MDNQQQHMQKLILWSVETGIDRNAGVENVTVRWTQYYYSIAQHIGISHAPSHLALILSTGSLTVHHTTVLTNLYKTTGSSEYWY